jgi:branched-chain amino acid transport system ATP-binding protein
MEGWGKVNEQATAILTTENLTKRFGGLTANNDLTLEIPGGRTTGLIGPNGSGKTTFINLVTGVYSLTSGTIRLEGKIISGRNSHEIAAMGVARTYQQIRLFNQLTVLENVMTARHVRFRTNLLDVFFGTKKLTGEEKAQREKAMEMLEIVGLADKAEEMPKNLPYGFRRNLEIARALALEPKLLLLDEPAAGMNRDEFMAVTDLIMRLRERGLSILLVEHTMEFVETVVDKVIVLNFGQKLAEGTFKEIENNPLVIEAYLGSKEEL